MSAPIQVPQEPTSTSPTSSVSGSPPPQLDPSTLALLNSFYQEREQQEQEFRELEEKAHKRLLRAKGEQVETVDQDQDETTQIATTEEQDKMMSVDEFRKLFQEDWQLSQFWYTASFASKLCKFIYSFSTPTTRIAFLCCPTSFVAFQNQNPLPDVWLLEYDGRFGLLGEKFVHYDLEEPEKIPKDLWGTVDIAIADPPFLNEITNKHLSAGLRKLLKPDSGKLILLTSTSVSSLPEIYSEQPLGPLNETSLRVEHAGGIQNEFRVWTSWKFEGEREGIRLVDDPVFQ
ncbi:hypothetical protein JCM5350_002973 [Sporobolomyces pararoseus]